MKYINLNQDWGIDRIANPTQPSDIALTAEWIENSMIDGYGKIGFKNGDSRRMFMSLKEKIKKVKESKVYYLEINPVEEVFIKSGFELCGGNPQTTLWIKHAEDAFNSATDQIPEAPKADVKPASDNVEISKK